MPSLHWIGKEKVINHHLDVPYRTLEHKYGFLEGELSGKQTGSGNKIIHGDNLEALKSLLPEYEGKIKCIYIDPPYNTGNENWVYNDSVNDPKIKKWLGQVVGKESEDLSRHDKWLCMMYPRLKLLHKLLSDDGVIFISIDDNEQANLRLICDEIWGIGNFISNFSWVRKKKGSFLSKKIRKMTEFVLCYQKSNYDLELYGENAYSDKWQPIVKRTNSIKTLKIPAGVVETKLDNGHYLKGFKGNEGTGINFLIDFDVHGGRVTSNLELEGAFVWTQEFLDSELNAGSRISLSNKMGFNVLRFNQSEKIKTPSTLINDENNVGTNEDASQNLQQIFGTTVNEVFNYSKPFSLIKYLVNMISFQDKNCIVLDSFAGSGTTAHAVLNLNKEDGGNRKFILIEMEDYADSITAERVKRVIKGYGEKEGTGGSFDYFELGPTLFNEDGEINELVGVQKLRQYIYYTETRLHIGDQDKRLSDNEYFLGQANDTSYYFYYEQDSPTSLDYDFLSTIKNKAGQYVIYADVCLLSKEFLTKHKIVFKKIPRDITKF
jgi:adenine-specific DNA-methyltransferase